MAWKRLEQFNGEKYPKCVKSLLISAGYDTFTSLSELNVAKIRIIENFQNESKEYVAHLDCCFHAHYKQLDKFEFLPGHQSIILGIPEQIIKMKSVHVEKPKKKSNELSAASLILKKSQSDKQLKSSLIDNLMKYSGKVGYKFPDGLLSEDNLKKFERGSVEDNFVCKCHFSCPFCSRILPAIYKHFWMSSNITQHLKIHITEEIEAKEK